MFKGLRRKLRRRYVLLDEVDEHRLIGLFRTFIYKTRYHSATWNKEDQERALRSLHNDLGEALGLPTFFDSHKNYRLKDRVKFGLTLMEEKKRIWKGIEIKG